MATEKSPEELFAEREKRFNDVIALRKPDRIPVLVLFTLFTAKYAGIPFDEDMGHAEKCMEGNFITNMAFQPDLASPTLFFGPMLAAVDFKQLKWPGHGLPPDSSYQFVEGEYMNPDEYDHYLFDPTDFMIRRYWPRVMGKLGAFQQLQPLHQIISHYMGVNMGFLPFGLPEVGQALEAMKKAGEETLAALPHIVGNLERLKAAGLPTYFASATQAPFDTIGDYFRGTKGLMIDMYRRPDKVVKMCEKLLPIMLDYGIGGCRATGVPRINIPLHKGSEGFMSQEQFKRFYWPTLRELLIGLIKAGIVPVVWFQGEYTSRLEIIKDIPPGAALYWFESVDPVKAKKILKETVAIKGLFPMSLLVTGTTADVKSCCKKLIDTLGRDGGYVMGPAAGSLEDAKIENVRAMFEFTREYGVY